MNMTLSYWIPVIPSLLIETGEVEQFILQGKDVAVWRSEQGYVQIWENRCPHRSVRLSLGQVHGESLVCAYHGWRFAAQDGHCQRIPAQPEQRAPKSLCAKTYSAMEYLGMIWFAEHEIPYPFDGLQHDPHHPYKNHLNQSYSHDQNYPFYAGSVTLSTAINDVKKYLLKQNFNMIFKQQDELVWQGALDEHQLRIFLTPTEGVTTTIHAMSLHNTHCIQIHALLKRMRQTLEQGKMLQQEQISHV